MTVPSIIEGASFAILAHDGSWREIAAMGRDIYGDPDHLIDVRPLRDPGAIEFAGVEPMVRKAVEVPIAPGNRRERRAQAAKARRR